MQMIHQVIHNGEIYWTHEKTEPNNPKKWLKKKTITTKKAKAQLKANILLIKAWLGAYQREQELSACFHYLALHEIYDENRATFYDLANKIKTGNSLHAALSVVPTGLSQSHKKLLSQAEKNNQLAHVLDLISHDLVNTLSRRELISKKMRYPIFLGFMMLLFMHFIILSVFPELLSLYQSMGRTTDSLILKLSDNESLLLLIDGSFVTLLLIFHTSFFMKSKKMILRQLVYIPGILFIYRKKTTIQWLNTFCLCLESESPIPESWESANVQLSGSPLLKSFHMALVNIKNGATPSRALSLCHGIPKKWCASFQASEKQSRLLVGCKQLLASEVHELQEILEQLLAWLEPAILLVMAACVLSLILLLYLPILNSYNGHLML